MRDEQYPQGDRLGSNGGRQTPGVGSTPGAFGPFAPAGGAPPAIAHGSAESRDMAQQSQTDAHGDDGSRSPVAGATTGWAADEQHLASQSAVDGMQAGRFEFWGLPGYEDRPWRRPWQNYRWYGNCQAHVRPKPFKVWSPVSWEAGDWCREVLARDPCAYCGGPVDVIDHVEPRAAGGANDWMNLIGACSSCNCAKSAKSLLRFLLNRPDETECARARLDRADYALRTWLSDVSIYEVGRRAFEVGAKDLSIAAASARADLDHRLKWSETHRAAVGDTSVTHRRTR